MLKGSKLGTPGHSLALNYEVELQQLIGGGAPSLSRVSKCFQILDEVIPQLGVFQRVMQLVRQELNVAVYSSDHTSQPAFLRQHKNKESHLAPLPYFVLAQRLGEKKAGEHSKLKSEISSLKEQLYMCEADLEKALSSLESYRHDIKERDAKIHHLVTDLRTCCTENERLQEMIGLNQHAKEHLCQELDFQMFSLRSTIANLKEENGRLRRYKVTHDQLQETQLLTKHGATYEAANRQTEMEQHSSAVNKLKLQLLTLQNSMMDEHDHWLQFCYSAQSQVSPAEMQKKKKVFKSKISSLSAELGLLNQHEEMLSQRLSQLKSGKSDSSSSHRALVLPLHPLNPLISQEQTSNKYAAMISTSSDGGTNFYPLKVAQHCTSCAQKTVLCPHKVCDDLVIQLPVNSTHMRITRPGLQLLQPKPYVVETVDEKVAESVALTQGLHMVAPDFGYLWAQFNKKFPKYELAQMRNITKEQLLDLVQQYYATLVLQDDTATLASDDTNDEDGPLTLYELLFEFVQNHYHMRSLAPISCHALITSLQENHVNNKELLILGHVLCGDLDGCCLRYALLQASLVEAVSQWISHNQFSAFITLLYPFLGEEGVEQLCLSYVAHSDNCLSAELVLDFLQILLLSHKDPLVVMLEAELMEQPGRVVGSMLEAEFAEAMEKKVPATSDLLCHRLFLQSLASYREKTQLGKQSLPVRNLAYIAAYFYRLNGQSELVVKLQELGVAAANSSEKEKPTHQHQQQQQRQRAKQRDAVHTMDTTTKMAERIKALKT